MEISKIKNLMNNENFNFFNAWVKDFFKREYLRENNQLNQYVLNPLLGNAMRPEVSFWNPNRSKHAEVYWLENFVFIDNVSPKNRVLNAIAVKFVGMPTLTLVANRTNDYSKLIDFELYKNNSDYFNWINNNLDENFFRLKVWGSTQLQTSLQTAARNYCRIIDGDENKQFKLSMMIRWISYLDDLGLTNIVTDENSSLQQVCEWLLKHKGIGAYFGYHPPCNFSRDHTLPHISEDDDYCLVGPGAKAGLQYVFPTINFNKNSIMEEFIVSIKHNQYEFFEFNNEEEFYYFQNNLENNKLTTFGTEITFCQFYCYLSIMNSEKAQQKRMLPLTFNSFIDIANKIDSTNIAYFIQENSMSENINGNLEKKNLIIQTANELEAFSHSKLCENLEAKGKLSLFNNESNWKETWSILQKLVSEGILYKYGKKYYTTKQTDLDTDIVETVIVKDVNKDLIDINKAEELKTYDNSNSSVDNNQLSETDYKNEYTKIESKDSNNPIKNMLDFDEFYRFDISGFDTETLRKFLGFRLRFLDEELVEIKKAIIEQNYSEIVDGLIDLIVVAIGTLTLFKVDVQKAWDEVYKANMSKIIGSQEKRPDSFGMDLIKSENWKAPNHEDNTGLFKKIANEENK